MAAVLGWAGLGWAGWTCLAGSGGCLCCAVVSCDGVTAACRAQHQRCLNRACNTPCHTVCNTVTLFVTLSHCLWHCHTVCNTGRLHVPCYIQKLNHNVTYSPASKWVSKLTLFSNYRDRAFCWRNKKYFSKCRLWYRRTLWRPASGPSNTVAQQVYSQSNVEIWGPWLHGGSFCTLFQYLYLRCKYPFMILL